MGLLALSVAWHGLSIFLAATAMSGVGYSLLFLGGLALINGAVPADHRGGVLSALYLFAYLSLGTVALVLGAVATQRGLGLAVNLGAGIITLLSLATIGLLALQRMHTPKGAAHSLSAEAAASQPEHQSDQRIDPCSFTIRRRRPILAASACSWQRRASVPLRPVNLAREGTVLRRVQGDQSAPAGAGARSRRRHDGRGSPGDLALS